MTPEQVLSNASAYHDKVVVVSGMAYEVSERVSRSNRMYHKFIIANPKGPDVMHVFSYGPALIQDGDRVIVKGRFRKLNRVGYAIYRNEIEASSGYVRLKPD